MGLASLLVDLIVIGVDQFLQRICRLGVTLVDMGHLMVGIPVDPGVKQINDGISQHHAYRRQQQMGVVRSSRRSHRLRQQVKTYHRCHHAGSETQQQADRPAGILSEQAGHHAAQSCPAHTGSRRDADDLPKQIQSHPSR